MRQPLGVCVGITPFNFPAMVPMWMFARHRLRQQLHTQSIGKVPSTALRLAELLAQAGLPPVS